MVSSGAEAHGRQRERDARGNKALKTLAENTVNLGRNVCGTRFANGKVWHFAVNFT